MHEDDMKGLDSQISCSVPDQRRSRDRHGVKPVMLVANKVTIHEELTFENSDEPSPHAKMASIGFLSTD